MSTGPDTRPYRKRARARSEDETRRRITEAVMELHRTVGPASTRVTEVAERAGVSRMTVYNHFPTDADLIEACSTHWASENPFPDPAAWAEEPDAAVRLRHALAELYRWYSGTADMMGNVLRDAPIVPALGAIMDERWTPYVDAMVSVLAEGRGAGGGAGRRPGRAPGGDPQPAPGRALDPTLEAALRLVVDFGTWRVLTDGGLDDAAAAELAARMVECGSRAF